MIIYVTSSEPLTNVDNLMLKFMLMGGEHFNCFSYLGSIENRNYFSIDRRVDYWSMALYLNGAKMLPIEDYQIEWDEKIIQGLGF